MLLLRRFLPLCLLLLSGCISGIDYGKVPHSLLSAGPVCNPRVMEDVGESDKPMFAVTSRLPDCRDAAVRLTSFRSNDLRFARFDVTETRKAKGVKKSLSSSLSFQPEEQWWAALAKAAAASDGRVLLYVHGFRETFTTSARDTAQIQRLSGFSGPVIQYSWPSQGELLSYGVDETNMYWDERNFREFLRKLAEKPWVKDITLVSHSLGARLVIPSIEYVDKNAHNQDASNISNIILASPDTDRREFERDIGSVILSEKRVKAGRRLTVYVSIKDGALGVSRTIHGYPRLGRPFCFDPFEAAELKSRNLPERCYASGFRNSDVMDLRGLTIIDTSEVSIGRSGHSDYLRSARACRDFALTLQRKDRMVDERLNTHLPYVFILKPYEKNDKPDHAVICQRFVS